MALLIGLSATQTKADIVFDAVFEDFKIKVTMDFDKKKVCFSKRAAVKKIRTLPKSKIQRGADTFVTDGKGRLWMLFTLLESEREVWGVVRLTTGETGVIVGTSDGLANLPPVSVQNDDYDGPYPSLNDGFMSHVHGMKAGRQVIAIEPEPQEMRMQMLEERLENLEEELEMQERLGESKVEETEETDETTPEAENDESSEGQCTDMEEADES